MSNHLLATHSVAQHCAELLPRLDALQKELRALQNITPLPCFWADIDETLRSIGSLGCDLGTIHETIEESYPGLSDSSDPMEVLNLLLADAAEGPDL